MNVDVPKNRKSQLLHHQGSFLYLKHSLLSFMMWTRSTFSNVGFGNSIILSSMGERF
jgi:hypothetical protein